MFHNFSLLTRKHGRRRINFEESWTVERLGFVTLNCLHGRFFFFFFPCGQTDLILGLYFLSIFVFIYCIILERYLRFLFNFFLKKFIFTMRRKNSNSKYLIGNTTGVKRTINHKVFGMGQYLLIQKSIWRYTAHLTLYQKLVQEWHVLRHIWYDIQAIKIKN